MIDYAAGEGLMQQSKSIDEEVRDAVRRNCDHVCHRGRGLNAWVETCPVCGCPNPKYRASAHVAVVAAHIIDPPREPDEAVLQRRGKVLQQAEERRQAKAARRAERHRRSQEGRRP